MPKTAVAAKDVQKPPVFELQGKKWVVVCALDFFTSRSLCKLCAQEHQKGNKNITIENPDLKQVVYAYKSAML